MMGRSKRPIAREAKEGGSYQAKEETLMEDMRKRHVSLIKRGVPVMVGRLE